MEGDHPLKQTPKGKEAFSISWCLQIMTRFPPGRVCFWQSDRVQHRVPLPVEIHGMISGTMRDTETLQHLGLTKKHFLLVQVARELLPVEEVSKTSERLFLNWTLTLPSPTCKGWSMFQKASPT